MGAEFKFEFQEDEHGHAEPTIKMTGGEWLPSEEDLIRAIAEHVSEQSVYPTRLDLTILNGSHVMGLEVIV